MCIQDTHRLMAYIPPPSPRPCVEASSRCLAPALSNRRKTDSYGVRAPLWDGRSCLESCRHSILSSLQFRLMMVLYAAWRPYSRASRKKVNNAPFSKYAHSKASVIRRVSSSKRMVDASDVESCRLTVVENTLYSSSYGLRGLMPSIRKASTLIGMCRSH